MERITASFTFKSIEEAEAAESDAKFQKEAASERFNEAKALKESLEKKINANETLLKSYAEQLPKLKEDSENDAKEMGRSCYSHSIGCAYGGNNTYGFA